MTNRDKRLIAKWEGTASETDEETDWEKGYNAALRKCAGDLKRKSTKSMNEEKLLQILARMRDGHEMKHPDSYRNQELWAKEIEEKVLRDD